MSGDEGPRRDAQASNARTFAAALASQAIGPLVISPGSRSTPLVLACAEHPEIETISAVDERSAAFFALGWARATGRPAVLLCTSGSAAGHYLPAIMEADQAELPMLIVTANRPIERESSGASQTAVQRHLYGHAVRRDYEVDLTLGSGRGGAAVGRVVTQALSRSRAPLPGPVHVDVRIRKPLEPQEWPPSEPARADAPRWFPGRWQVDDRALDEIVGLVAAANRPMLVAGPSPRWVSEGLPHAASLSTQGLPLFCEWSSQLRGHSRFWALGAGLQSTRIREHLRPDLVLQLGTAPVTSGWEPWIEESVAAGARHVVVQSGRMRDARSTATHVLTSDPVRCLERLAVGLADAGGDGWTEWHRTLEDTHRSVVRVLEQELDRSGLELRAARAAVTERPAGILGLGNSLAIRHVEALPAPSKVDAPRWSWIWHQRGLSGIDGLIAGMAGSLCAEADRAGAAVPARLLLGDVSFVHDLGSLGLLRSSWSRRLDVVVLDNGGGRIFDRLPLAQLALDPSTRDLFSTPTRIDFARAVAAHGLDYLEIADIDQLSAAFAAAGEGARVLHVRCPDAEGTADHRRILAALDRIE